jgi:hypothetical protein
MGAQLSGDGFMVDLGALLAAKQGIAATMQAVDDRQVKDLDCEPAAFGHDRLAATTKDFCDRWQRGVENLVRDGQEVADQLAKAARTYLEVEQAVGDELALAGDSLPASGGGD